MVDLGDPTVVKVLAALAAVLAMALLPALKGLLAGGGGASSAKDPLVRARPLRPGASRRRCRSSSTAWSVASMTSVTPGKLSKGLGTLTSPGPA